MKLYRLCSCLVTAVALVSSEARAQVFGVQAMLSGDMDGDGRTGIYAICRFDRVPAAPVSPRWSLDADRLWPEVT